MAEPRFWATAGFLSLILLSAVYLDYVFRLRSAVWLRSGLGDWQDPYFINGLLEQWRYSVLHLSNPVSPPMFFPERGTLGYSHSLVLYFPFYLVARLGLDPFLAYTLTVLSVIEVGVLCLYLLFRRVLFLAVPESLVLVAAFATSRNIINGPSGVWTQRISVFLIPPILLIGFASARRQPGALKWVGLATAGLLAASLYTQDIYTGLLAALIALLLSIGVLPLCKMPSIGIRLSIPRTRRPLGGARRFAMLLVSFVVIAALAWAWVSKFGSIFGIPFAPHHHHWERPLAAALIGLAALELLRGGCWRRVIVTDRAAALATGALVAGAALGLLGFFYVYYRAFLQHGGFPEQEVMAALVQHRPADWREMLRSPASWLPFESGRSFAVVFTLGIACCVPRFGVPWRLRLNALWLVAAALIVAAVPMRIGDFAPWKYVMGLPLFSAIRDPRRIVYPFELGIALALGLLVSRLPRASLLRRTVPPLVAIAIIADWNMKKFDYERPIEAFEAWVEAPIAVDVSCRSFFIERASAAYTSRARHMPSLYGNDAVFIATKYGVPTLNGFSAWEPPEWHLAEPQNTGYQAAVDGWIARHHLQGVCRLDIDRRTMTPYAAPTALGR